MRNFQFKLKNDENFQFDSVQVLIKKKIKTEKKQKSIIKIKIYDIFKF